MENIFVYGTLKRGFPNHDKKLLGQCYLGSGQSVKPYPLVIANQYYSPVLIDEAGEGNQVTGELYLVNNTTLELLDIIEGVGQSWGYHRTAIAILRTNGNTINTCAYMKHHKDLQVIHSEALSHYELDARYVHPSKRS